jgi:hypothetical protein
VHTSAADVIRKRVHELDATDPPTTEGASDRRLQHFVLVMSSFTDARMEAECRGPAVVTPDAADLLVDESALLRSIAGDEPQLVTGPVRRDMQEWIATGRHEPAAPAGTHPRVVYTSTATRRGPSMWRTYLNLHYEPDLHPLPWRIWRLEADANAAVREIASAREWVDFVERYPARGAHLVSPDWVSASRDYAGVHLTLRAIVAAQGFSFATDRGMTEPQYWDVESTRWLSWKFGSPVLVETATEVPTGL